MPAAGKARAGLISSHLVRGHVARGGLVGSPGLLWGQSAAWAASHGDALLGAGGGRTLKQGTGLSPALQGAWCRGEEGSGSQLTPRVLPSWMLVSPGRSEKTLSQLSALEISSAERLRRLWARSTFLFNIHLGIYFARKGRGGEIAFLGERRAGLAALSEPRQRSRARGRRGGSGGSAAPRSPRFVCLGQGPGRWFRVRLFLLSACGSVLQNRWVWKLCDAGGSQHPC